MKDKTSKDKLSNIIYQITCECGQKYIGQTQQYLEKRIYGHKHHIELGEEEHSALCRHAIENKHIPDWDIQNIKILAKFNSTFDLRTKLNINEIIHIKKTNYTLNYKTDIINLPALYNTLLGI